MCVRRFFLLASSLLVVMLIAACGSSTTSSNPSAGTSATATTAPTTSTPPSAIKTATATVKGQSETILTNAQGQTLYYFTPDTAAKVACTGGCAQAWPPLLFTSSGMPLSDVPLTGVLSALGGANGSQIAYSGHPLYTYSGDTAPGQTTGEGLFGKWFVCTPSLPS